MGNKKRPKLPSEIPPRLRYHLGKLLIQIGFLVFGVSGVILWMYLSPESYKKYDGSLLEIIRSIDVQLKDPLPDSSSVIGLDRSPIEIESIAVLSIDTDSLRLLVNEDRTVSLPNNMTPEDWKEIGSLLYSREQRENRNFALIILFFSIATTQFLNWRVRVRERKKFMAINQQIKGNEE